MLRHSHLVRGGGERIPGTIWTEERTVGGVDAEAKMDLHAMESALEEVLNQFGMTDVAPEILQALAAKEPHLFFEAGLARLQLEGGRPGFRKRSLRLLDVPAFLLELICSDHFSTKELKDFCGKYIHEDTLLDVKLARLMPGRRLDVHHLETTSILRLLDVLDEISPGPRLLMIIGHLTQHDNHHVASKATLLVGRRLLSREWVERHLTSSDSRVRASVTEALWSANSELAAKTFRRCLNDENNRVRGNALVGLHLIGDRSASALVRNLTKDSRPVFRQTAAWVIGKMEAVDLVPLLEELSMDSDQGVRQSAATALEKMRETVLRNAALAPKDNAKHALTGEPKPLEREPAKAVADSETAAAKSEATFETEVVQCAPEQEQATSPEQKPTLIPFNLRLDGRYVTGD